MKINPIYIDNRCWQEVKRRIEGQILAYRHKLEADSDETQTAKIRGSIQALKDVLKYELTPPPDNDRQ